MSQAFIIMQIGNSELDVMCREVIVPALKALGLDPKRVDKHNEGRLLKSEIVSFMQDSPIIVAEKWLRKFEQAVRWRICYR